MSSIKPLVLWDVDGTLISDSVSGELRYEEAVARVLGVSELAPPESTSGGTDHGILERLFIREGLAAAQAQLLVPAALYYLEAITTNKEELSADRELLPGVLNLVEKLVEAGSIQTVVTGNSRRRAEAKMMACGVPTDVEVVPGGFGDRTSERWRLVEEARERVGLLHYGREDAVPLRNTYVIGDTVHDVKAAHDAGAVAIAVATGSYSIQELTSSKADLVISDVRSGAEVVLEQILGKPE